MASVGFLALLDDIATLLDDVSTMTKVAAKNTAGVLGDDLALNAEQVSGVRAKRELPVVWAVAKGSFLNKVILVPLALAISALAPWLVTVLLMIGGLYLCYEGVEKIAHKWLHSDEERQHEHAELTKARVDSNIDLVAFEKKKIKGAIRTDFILSAEIIVIALGAAQGANMLTQSIVVSAIAVLVTVAVYGIVAAIVKFDDAGLALIESADDSGWGRFKDHLGDAMLFIAPRMMRFLSVVGMIAMFLVGGGILVHGLPFLHHILELLPQMAAVIAVIIPVLFNALVGIFAGIIVLACVLLISRLRTAVAA